MELVESIKRALQERVLPELGVIRAENGEIKARLELTNKRLDDLHADLLDVSRRIDGTNKRIDDTNKRIDETNKGVDGMRSELSARIEDVRAQLTTHMDRLYEVIVRRDEHVAVAERDAHLERDVQEIKARLAA